MKKISISLLFLLSFTACKKNTKNDDGIIIEPPQTYIISNDTLKTGDLWGLNIGTTAADLYAKVLTIKAERKISNLQVVGNIFTKIDSLENRLPLYTFVYLDQAVGTGNGIQIYFADDKVSGIWTNDGVKLSRWPANGSSSSVTPGDAVTAVYKKLLTLSKVSSFASKFERISVFSKDINKTYDPYMALSRQWYFASPVDATHYRVIELNLKDGKLFSINNTLIGSY